MRKFLRTRRPSRNRRRWNWALMFEAAVLLLAPSFALTAELAPEPWRSQGRFWRWLRRL